MDIYLDWAATAIPENEILTRVHELELKQFGNPSSLHREGQKAKEILEESRQRLADVLGCSGNELIFTSGGTEANNMVLLSQLNRKGNRKIVISCLEHASVFEPAKLLSSKGHQVVYVQAGEDGRIDPDRLEAELDANTALVAVMLVNNETGAIQDLPGIAERIDRFARIAGRKIHFHADAVQALGKIPFSLDSAVDSASFSAHKLAGPRGVGALYLRRGGTLQFLYTGGGQEQGRRPGTENLPGIFGLALAAEGKQGSLENNLTHVRGLSRNLIPKILDLGAQIIPHSRIEEEERFSPYILCAAFPPVPGEVLVRVLDQEGIALSTGSACSARKKNSSRVLENMGVPAGLAASAIRISFGARTSEKDLDRLVQALKARLPELTQIAGSRQL